MSMGEIGRCKSEIGCVEKASEDVPSVSEIRVGDPPPEGGSLRRRSSPSSSSPSVVYLLVAIKAFVAVKAPVHSLPLPFSIRPPPHPLDLHLPPPSSSAAHRPITEPPVPPVLPLQKIMPSVKFGSEMVPPLSAHSLLPPLCSNCQGTKDLLAVRPVFINLLEVTVAIPLSPGPVGLQIRGTSGLLRLTSRTNFARLAFGSVYLLFSLADVFGSLGYWSVVVLSFGSQWLRLDGWVAATTQFVVERRKG